MIYSIKFSMVHNITVNMMHNFLSHNLRRSFSRAASFIPTSPVVNIMGNGSIYSPPCMSVSNGKCYWFNTTSSGVLNHKLLIKNIGHVKGVFLTSMQWETSISGLLQLFQDFNEPKLCVIGPSGTEEFIRKYISNFTSRYSRKWLDTTNFININSTQELFSDGNLSMCVSPIVNESNPNDLVTLTYVGHFSRTLDDNSWICDKDTIFHSKSLSKYGTFMVVECPTLGHLQSLKKGDILSNNTNSNKFNSPVLISHITPPDVFNSQDYQEWIGSFNKDCNHLVLNEGNSPGIINHALHRHQLMLHNACDYFFPPPDALCEDISVSSVPETNITKAQCLLKAHINPTGLTWDFSSVLTPKDIVEDVKQHMDKLEVSEKETLYKLQSDFKNTKKENKKYPLVVNLGTGPSSASYYRTHSAHLVFLSPKSSILLDCGGGTLQKLYQHYGSKIGNILKSIKCIFLSHAHVDHHIGFVSLIEAIDRVNPNKKVICLLFDHTYIDYFKEYEPKLQYGLLMQNVHRTLPLKTIKDYLELQYLRICPVHHTEGTNTMGLVLIDKSGFKISYTSDTRPIPRLFVGPAKNSDLLIHDCEHAIQEYPTDKTYVAKGHSDFNGALRTQFATKSKFLLLTHFKPYAPGIAICEESLKKTNNTCFAAFDHLSVYSNQYYLLPKVYEMLFTMFKKKQVKKLVELRRRAKQSESKNKEQNKTL